MVRFHAIWAKEKQATAPPIHRGKRCPSFSFGLAMSAVRVNMKKKSTVIELRRSTTFNGKYFEMFPLGIE